MAFLDYGGVTALVKQLKNWFALKTEITSKQDKLVSGTNIKTINGESILGSGNLAVGGLPTVSASDNDKVLTVANGEWVVANLPVYNGAVE